MANRKTRGQVIKRGDQTYLIRWYLGRDKNGKRKYTSETVKGSKKHAEETLTKRLRELDVHDVVVQTEKTVEDHVEEFLGTRQDVVRRTRDNQITHYELYVKPFLGALKLRELSRPRLRRWHQQLLDDVGISPGTIQIAHGVLRKALAQAVEDKMLRENVADRMTLPRQTKRKEEIVRPLTVSQTKKLLRVVKEEEPKYYPLVLLLLTTGLRPNEALALKWADLKGNRLHVRRAKSRENRGRDKKTMNLVREGVLEFTSGKTFAAERSITLPEQTVAALKEHRINQLQTQSRFQEYHDRDFVFTTRRGDPYLEEPMRKVWKRLLQKAGLPDRRLYDARHTHATHLLESGVPVKVVSERLGHRNVTITLQTYSHVLPDMQDQVAEKAGEVLFAS